MTAPKTRSTPALAPGAVIRGVDFASEPVANPPEWATTLVRIIKKGGEEIEVGGVRYLLCPGDKPRQMNDPCHWCAARVNDRLCNVICSYCENGKVFQRKLSNKVAKGPFF